MGAPGAPGTETPGQDRSGEEATDPKGNSELRCPVWLVESGGGQRSWTHLHPEAAALRGTERSQPGADTRRWAAVHLASPEACCCHSRQLRLALRELAAGCLATRLLHTEPATHVCSTLAVAPTHCTSTQSCMPPCTHTCTHTHTVAHLCMHKHARHHTGLHAHVHTHMRANHTPRRWARAHTHAHAEVTLRLEASSSPAFAYPTPFPQSFLQSPRPARFCPSSPLHKAIPHRPTQSPVVVGAS